MTDSDLLRVGGIDQLPFSAAEYDSRLSACRREMHDRGIDVLVLSSRRTSTEPFPPEQMEKAHYFRPGNLGYPVFTSDFGIKIGITICYERHFPEGPRSLALANAHVIFVPTATSNGRSIWELELQGHAIANLLWVAGVNRVGVDDGGGETNFYGSSCFVSPTGEVVAQADDADEEILHWEIDTAVSQQLRDTWGFFRDRRPEIYAAVTAP